MRKVFVVSNGKVSGTKVFDAESKEKIKLVHSITFDFRVSLDSGVSVGATMAVLDSLPYDLEPFTVRQERVEVTSFVLATDVAISGEI